MIKINKITEVPLWVTVLRIIFKIVTTIILLIVIPLIIINIAFIFQKSDTVPSFMGYSILNVVSGSMKDTINVGDMIIIKQTKEVNEQDIITFMDKESSFTTHRIVRTEQIDGNRVYTTKGDANNTEDMNKVTSEQIVGKLVFHVAGFGKLSSQLQKPQGFLILVSFPTILIFITKFFEIRFANKKAMRKQERIEYMAKNK